MLEATAFQTREVVEAMEKDAGIPVDVLRTDGGMVENDLLMQFQADILNRPVVRPAVKETTALGAAYAAGLAVGFYADVEELKSYWSVDRTWQPSMDEAHRERLYGFWKKAVQPFLRLAGGLMDKRLLGEFMGTMVLILMGNGVVANVRPPQKSKGENAGWMVISTAWGMAVMLGVFTAVAFGSPDAHLNPAVTLGDAIVTDDFSKVAVYLAQMAGAITGAILVWLFYFPHWRETPEADLKQACFCTSPAIRWPLLQSAERDHRHLHPGGGGGRHLSPRPPWRPGPASGLGPYLVGSLVWAIGLSLGGTTGYAINPARDLGPRIAHAHSAHFARRAARTGATPPCRSSAR